MATLGIQNSSTPAGQILEYLLRNTTASIKDLEDTLGVTATAVRQQLVSLSAEGLVIMTRERQGVGRPRNVYKLTERSQSLFACYSDELALDLIHELLESEGTAKLRYLLSRVGDKLAGQYNRQMKGQVVGDRILELSVLLDRRGIRADIENADGVIILHEYNCPYHDLSSVHRDVCEMERDTFSQVLGADVTLGNCIHDGHNSCQFVVSAAPTVGGTRRPISFQAGK